MWLSGSFAVETKLRTALRCAGMLVVLLISQLAPHDSIDAELDTTAHPAAFGRPQQQSVLMLRDRRSSAEQVVAASSLVAVRNRWNASWSTDVAAAELNVANLHHTASLIARADHGDLEATVDLVAAATWCLTGGPLTNVTELVGDERRPCVERFGDALASRERLERASFVWVLRLAAAGVEDAALYGSALTRGVGPELLGGPDNDPDVSDQQRALLIGQLQTLVEGGSADAASELHGHWGGYSALRLTDERLTRHFATLTEQLDPTRSLALVTQ
jgi:hypothetical protein